MYEQTARILPALKELFAGVAIYATAATQERSLALLAEYECIVRREPPGTPNGLPELGRSRRAVVALALEWDAPCMLFCDFDRALHWAEYYPAELAQVAAAAEEHDFVVLGRTPRAFASHPRTQRDTEAIINHVYATVSGRTWDVTAAARLISRTAAAAILDGCPEHSVGTDVAWPLFVGRAHDLRIDYVETEGLEFETADRYADEIAAAGGLERWIDRLDADPSNWALRLELARLEVAAAKPYAEMKPITRRQQ
ncbi:MAG TPA: hypothetical protein VFX76_07485 [Roseiflexaceae bacterium]|nr:hypothetical protein [Roseiflexaceae bacterium]